MPDRITILRSRGLPMAKRYLADGTIEPYSRAKHFRWEQREAGSLDDLSALLAELEHDPHACIIRGAPKSGSPPEIRRLIESVDDHPLHAVCIEVDSYAPLLSDPLDGEEAAREFVTECLPDVFHGVSFHWQLSNSAGAPGKTHLFKGHIWYWLATPYDSAVLRAWAKACAPAIDRAVLQPVQVHYTAAPIFDDGVADPVTRRSGLWRGALDTVGLSIDTEALDIKAQGVRQRGERRDIDDPQADWIEAHWETWGVLGDGGVIVSCPFAEEHSSGVAGDTSTVYFPAGTGGYAEGSWVCLHNTCRDRPQGEFKQRCGYTDSQFTALAVAETPRVEVNGTKVNGVHVQDPLILPPFKRTGSGQVVTNLINVRMALESPRVSPWTLRYDVFKDAIVRAPWGCEDWRPLEDSDYTALRIAMETEGLNNVGREMIRDGVHYVARHNAFDTAVEWLDRLTWDGTPRIETFWIDHFGVPDDELGYAKAVGRYTWSALAGRVLVPGVQADMVPILTGRQGIRKSRGVQAMAPAPSFATHMNFHEKDVDRARKMRGRLIIELPELQGLKSRDAEEILAWVTRSEEDWTPKFMEMNTTYKRRFLMIATTNEGDFLDNPHGERRWLPLAAGRAEGFGMVDTDRLAEEREQLWAEGRERFLSVGVDWQDAETLAKTQHGMWKSEDDYRPAIERWLATPGMGGDAPRNRPYLMLLDVAADALGIPVRGLKPYDRRRIGKVLSELGYENRLGRDGRDVVRAWWPSEFV